jgi:hypothetical protein
MHHVEADVVNLAKAETKKEKYSVCARSDKIFPAVRMCVEVRWLVNIVMHCLMTLLHLWVLSRI